METLSFHNHFASPLNSSPYYEFEMNHEREAIRVPTRNLTITNRDRASVKVQEVQAKTDSHCEERRFIEETALDKSMSSTDSCVVPPRENSPAVFVPEPVDDILGAIDDDVEREYFMRCVVIGGENTGKHSLVNANFSEELVQAPHKNGADLLLKTAVRSRTTKKYHFWVRSLSDNDTATKEAIWSAYYKTANTFVFVYDTTDKKSFEALEKAVRNVLQVVPQDKFFGALVGTKNDLYTQREVDYDAVVDFKRKYNFSHFIETNSSIESETPQMLPRIDSKLKLTFESI